MRELKFRGWDPTVGRFDYYSLDIGDETYIDSDVEVLEQFTGLKDKNRKDIYDGDIGRRMIKMDNFNPGGGMGQPRYDRPATEWWEEERIGLIKIHDDGSPTFWGQRINQNDAQEIEIIGNIHENKELIKSLS